MAEEIRVRLVVDTANGTATIKQLESMIESLKKKLTEIKASGPVIPKESFTPVANSLDGIKAKLADLKKKLSASEIGGDSFKQLSKDVQSTEAELKNVTNAAKGIAGAITPAVGSVADLRARVKEMTAELNNVQIGSERFHELEIKIFNANSKLKDIKADLKGAIPEQVISSFIKLGQGAVAGFAAASSAVSLFSGNARTAEAAQKAMAKAQEYLTLVTSLGAVASAVHESREARLLIVQNARTVATRGLAIAQGVLNAIMSANPIAIIVLAVAGLIAGFIALKDKVKIIGEAFSFLGKVVDFVLTPLKALGKAIGIISDDSTATLKKNLAEQFQDVADRYDNEIKVAQAAHKNTEDLERRKLEVVRKSIAAQILLLEDLGVTQKGLTDAQLKKLDELKKKQEENASDIKVLASNTEKSVRDEQSKSANEKLNALRDGYAKEVALARQSTADKIQSIRDSTQSEKEKQAQIASITQQGRNELAKLSTDHEKQLLDDRNKLAIISAKEGTKERLDAELNAITSTRDLLLKNTKLTEDERKIIVVQAENDIFETKKTNAEKAKAIAKGFADAFHKQQTDILDAIRSSENSQITIRQAAVEKQRLQGVTLLQDKIALIAEEKKILEDSEIGGTKDRLARLAQANREAHDGILVEDRAYLDAKEAIEVESANKILAIQKDSILQVQELKVTAREADVREAQLASDVAGALHEIENTFFEARSQKESERIKKFELGIEKEKKLNKQKLDQGLITQGQYEVKNNELDSKSKQEKINSEQKFNDEKKAISKRYALFELATGLAKIYADTALAVAKSEAQFPITFGQPFAGYAIANGVIQAAVLIAQKAAVLSLATGGVVDGPGTATSDSVPARLSVGESVINARSTSMFRPILSAMNVAGGGVSFDNSRSKFRFADGGTVVTDGSSVVNLEQSSERVDKILEKLDNLKVYVAETDIREVTNKVSIIESRAKIN